MGLGWKAWTRERLPADELQGYIQDQVVMVFESAAARDAELPVPVAGMHCHLSDVKRDLWYDGDSWELLGPMPSLGVVKAAVQAIGAGAWTLVSWDAPPAARIAAGAAAVGMWTAPGRLVATATGRWGCSLAINGVDNAQIRVNAAGNAASGNMVVGGGVGSANHANLSRQDLILNTGDYLEVFAFRAAAGSVGPVASYVSHFAMTYHGRT